MKKRIFILLLLFIAIIGYGSEQTGLAQRAPIGALKAFNVNLQKWDVVRLTSAGLLDVAASSVIGSLPIFGVNNIPIGGALGYQESTGKFIGIGMDADGKLIVSSAGGSGTTFSDNDFSIFNETDSSKKAELDASSITTATTRTYVLPDKDGTIALISDIGTGGSGIVDGTVDGQILTWNITSATWEVNGGYHQLSTAESTEVEYQFTVDITDAFITVEMFKEDGTRIVPGISREVDDTGFWITLNQPITDEAHIYYYLKRY